MNLSKSKLIILFIAILGGGLLMGWILFSENTEQAHSHANVINSQTEWTCSMHPQIRQNEPGDCPICGMDLIPLEEDDTDGIDPMAVSMSPAAVQLANISTIIVGKSSVAKTIELNGKVQEDERLIFSQSSHFPGRIEELSVNFTGEYVARGTAIATIYSPELVTAQEELFEAYKIREVQPSLFRAAREKLKKWKINDNQIDEILVTGEAKDEFPVFSDQSGYVVSRKVNLGDYVARGETLYTIANLSRVWIFFDVYERDLNWIEKGDSIQFSVNALPGEQFLAAIDYIDPVIDPKTRVAKARVVASNPNQRLKPEMFASGKIKAMLNTSGTQLTIPKSAVMWTGKRSVVYVKEHTDQGLYFKMREIGLGPALGESFLVEDGLETGEEIAVSGTFSIDAAAQLAGKPSMMNRHPTAHSLAASGSGHNHGSSTGSENNAVEKKSSFDVNTSEKVYDSDGLFQNQLKEVFNTYLTLKEALVDSDLNQATNAANTVLVSINEVDMSLVKGEAHMEWMKDLSVLKEASRKMTEQDDLADARGLLSPLSDQLYHTLKKFDVSVDGYRQYCPMAFDFNGAFWLSDSEEILNPYFGDEMLTCGNIEEKLK